MNCREAPPEIARTSHNWLSHIVSSKIGKTAALSLVVVGFLGAAKPAKGDDGGYPWANAPEVNQPTYDWGYTECQPAMQAAGTCDTLNVVKPGTNVLYHESDPWGYYIRNCTSYVAWRVNKEFGSNISGLGNADTWDTAAHGKGFKVSGLDPEKTRPEAGDIAQWDSMHVAFVESVNPDNSVNVTEYNYDPPGRFNHRGEAYGDKAVVADHYIDINGVGNGLNGSTGSNGGNTAPGIIPYSSIKEGQEFYGQNGWIYTKAGKRAWVIKWQGWTPEDTAKWGNYPVGPVSNTEISNNEVGYDANGRAYAAHAPEDRTTVYTDQDNTQYHFLNNKAWPITLGEVSDLGVQDQALMVPSSHNRLSDFKSYSGIVLPDRSIYKFADTPRVNILSYHPDNSADAYHVNNEAVRYCLDITEHQPYRILPNSMRPYIVDSRGMQVRELGQAAACAFPPQIVVKTPEDLKQFRVTGDNSSVGYQLHWYPSALLSYLHTGGSPDLRITKSIYGITQGSNMAPPQGAFFRYMPTGEVFISLNGEYRPVPSPQILGCYGNPSIINVPGYVMEGMVQGPPLQCAASASQPASTPASGPESAPPAVPAPAPSSEPAPQPAPAPSPGPSPPPTATGPEATQTSTPAALPLPASESTPPAQPAPAPSPESNPGTTTASPNSTSTSSPVSSSSAPKVSGSETTSSPTPQSAPASTSESNPGTTTASPNSAPVSVPASRPTSPAPKSSPAPKPKPVPTPSKPAIVLNQLPNRDTRYQPGPRQVPSSTQSPRKLPRPYSQPASRRPNPKRQPVTPTKSPKTLKAPTNLRKPKKASANR